MSKEKNDLALVNEQDLSFVDEKALSGNQLKFLLKGTPAQYKKTRKGKGGQNFTYVTGGYVKKVLNLMFGWDWDFEIVSDKIVMEANQVLVKGKLTCRSAGREIIKMQYGRADIKYRKDTKDPLDLGNDFKAAATDALKKCASELGVAADVYNADEFKEISVQTHEEQMSAQLRRVQDTINEINDLEELFSYTESLDTAGLITQHPEIKEWLKEAENDLIDEV